MNALSGGTLELVLGDADWGSTMAVEAGITPDLGGTLRVRFDDQANLESMLGTTFDFFNWPAVLDTNNRFDAIELPPGTQWDLNQLYLTGTAKLTFIPVTPGDYNRDGTVEAVFEGNEASLERLLAFAHDGPRGAQVERVEVFDEEPEGLSGFAIR